MKIAARFLDLRWMPLKSSMERAFGAGIEEPFLRLNQRGEPHRGAGMHEPRAEECELGLERQLRRHDRLRPLEAGDGEQRLAQAHLALPELHLDGAYIYDLYDRFL